MKNKLLYFLPLVLCALVLCGRFAQSTSAVGASVTAKEQPVQSMDKTLNEGLTALRSKQYDRAIKAAKQVLSTSSDSKTRIKAYQLLITTVRTSDGYDAAIRRCEGVYAFVKKSKSASKELEGVRLLLVDLKRRRSEYLRTIAEQQAIIKNEKDKEKASGASLKVASCKRALGPRAEAIASYEAVARDYPLTRPAWKALEELAWMRQAKDAAGAAKPSEPASASLIDGLQALKEGRLAEAEKTARALLSSSDAVTRSSALGLLIETLSKSSGSKIAARQAWQLACGTKEFKPSYSDVLRLEATVADLVDEPVKANETIAKTDDSAKPESIAMAETDGSTEVEASHETSESASGNRQRSRMAGTMASAVPRQGGYGGLPVGGAWPGVGPGGSSTKPNVRTRASNGTAPQRPAPTGGGSEPSTPGDPSPAPTVPSPKPPGDTPREPEKPLLDRWVCDTQFREADGDNQAIRSLMDEHLAEAEDIIYYDLIIDPSPTATLPAERLRALGIASTDAVWASRVLEDDDLALSICTLYLLPNLEDAYQERWDYRSREAILVVVTSVLQKAGKIDGLIDLYKWWISWDQCRNNADANCARLAELLIGQKRYEEAISYLKMIDETGECAASRGFIPILEARLREQQASNQGGQQ